MEGELDHAQSITLIDQILEFDEPYPALLMTGGDPLMRADFFDLVGHAKGKGLYVAVAASATPKLDGEAIARMKNLGVDIISVSLDGATPETHDRLRGVPGTWKSTIHALKMARDEGLRAQVNTTVMRSNVGELADIFHVAKEAGSVAWEVFFLIRTGRGAALESLQPGECEEVMHFLYDASQYGLPVRTSEGPSFRRVRLEREGGRPAYAGDLYRTLSARLRALEGPPTSSPSVSSSHTRDGKGLMFVGYNGEVYPSGFLPMKTGTVPRESLASIYRTSELFRDLRDARKLKGRCGACEYREVCGGSRSRAYAELGDPFGEDLACPYVPEADKQVAALA